MRKLFILFFGQIIFITANSQVGIGTTTPNNNAALEVSAANNKGILIPRGDALTRSALNTNTAKGLMLYDTTTNSLWIHDGNGSATGWHNQQKDNNGFVVPFMAGNINLTTTAAGDPNSILMLGFPSATIMPYSTSLTGFAYQYSGMLLPRNAEVVSMALYFNFNNTYFFPSPLTVTAQLYIADNTPGGTNIFTPLAGTITEIIFPNSVNAATFSSSLADNLSIPVPALSRLMMTVRISGPANVNVLANITASAGLK